MGMERGVRPVAVVVELGINGLGIIRSLGRRGIHVVGVDSKRWSYGALSRYCETVLCEDVNSPKVVETLIEVGRELPKKGALFCSSDLTLLIVSEHRKELQEFYSFVLPPDDLVRSFMSKRAFYEFAVENGFSVPKTFHTSSREEILEVGEWVSGPCVIKPEVRDGYWFRHVPEEKVLFVGSRDEYFELFKKYRISSRPLVVQEWIEGNDDDVYFCLTYIDRGLEPLAVFTGRKIRQYPVLTGVTSMAQSVWEPFIAEESLRLLRTAGCTGICGVEFKFCRRDGRYKITEPTIGRTDLQEAIAVECGLDLPYIAYTDSIGESQKPSRVFREGVKWINEPYDVYSASSYLKTGKCTRRELLLSYRGKRSYALLDYRDPIPFLVFLWRLLRMKFKKCVGGMRERSEGGLGRKAGLD